MYLYIEAASYALIGTNREKISLPMLFGSDGWNMYGFTNSNPKQKTHKIHVHVASSYHCCGIKLK